MQYFNCRSSRSRCKAERRLIPDRFFVTGQFGSTPASFKARSSSRISISCRFANCCMTSQSGKSLQVIWVGDRRAALTVATAGESLISISSSSGVPAISGDRMHGDKAVPWDAPAATRRDTAGDRMILGRGGYGRRPGRKCFIGRLSRWRLHRRRVAAERTITRIFRGRWGIRRTQAANHDDRHRSGRSQK